jgi:ABC-type bacteriocin/lantibiotic exporter with double-glycine peptidase domain
MINQFIGFINLIKIILLLFKEYPRKFLFLIFIFLTLLASFVEIASIASIIPLIDFLIDNNKYLNNEYIVLFIKYFDLQGIEIKLFFIIIFAVLIIFSFIIKTLLIFVQSYLNFEISFFIHNKVIKRILNQNYKYFIDNNTSNFLAITENVEALRNVVFSLLLLFMSSTIAASIIFLLITVNFINSLILFFIMCAVYFLMYYFTFKKLNNIAFLQSKIVNKKFSVFLELTQNIKEIILRNLHNYVFDKQYEIMLFLRNSRISAERYTAVPTYMATLFLSLLIIMALYFLSTKGSLVANSALIVFYIISLQRLLPHLQNIYVCFTKGIKNAQYVILNVLDVLNLPDKTNIKGVILEKDKIIINSEISIKNLTFSHNRKGKNNIIEKASMILKKGNLYGLIGASGSGKTTFFDVFMGLLKSCNGDFYVDKKKISIFNDNKWQQLISYVSQNSIIADGTFLENICYGTDLNNINKQHLLECARNAECLEFINSRKHRFQEYIGEGGVKISGGQRQRLLIARALYVNRPILLLDEATNALDKRTEIKIFRNLTKLKFNKIIIAIAHNDNIQDFFDTVYKIDNKKIIIN